MIEKLKVVNRDAPPITWWSKPFPHKRTFNFKPGVNVLWGPNGSGKSTVIKALARLTHCEQGGVSTVTQHSIDELFGFGFSNEPRKNMSIQFDGKPVVYFDPSVKTGLMGGSFDWDFGMEGIANTMDSGSAGQQAIGRFMRLLKRVEAEINWTVNEGRVNDVWANRIKLAREILEPTIEEGPATVLLDEPDATLDWPNKLPLWNWVKKAAAEGKVQFIVATHSIFGLQLMNLPGAHVIELKKGYREKCEEIVKAAGFWPTEEK